MKRRDLTSLRVDLGTPCIEGKPGDERGYVGSGHGRYEHRNAWRRRHGKIPAGLEIDHLCRNRACINPDHLEAVTHAENIRRAMALVDECAHGHPFSPENTYIDRRNARGCRTCHRDGERERKRRLRASA